MRSQRIKYLTQEEQRALLRTLRDHRSAERDYCLFNLILNTGLRLAEVLALNVCDVRDRTVLRVVGKGDKMREIPLNKAIRGHLEEFLRWKRRQDEGLSDLDPLFVSRNNGRVTSRPVQRALTKWLRLAGVEGHYSPHSLRHTFATQVYERTKNIRLVQDVLGHQNIGTTMIYTHVTKQEIAEAVELLTA